MFDVSKITTKTATPAPRIVLIGVEGVGKTTAGAQCPFPVFLSAEEGLVGQGEVPHFAPHAWQDAIDFIDHIATGKHDYKSLIIDTIDWLEPLLHTHILNRDQKKSIEDYGYGKGYVVAREEFGKLLAYLDIIHRRGIIVMVLAHCQIKTFNNPAGDNYDRYELKLSKQITAVMKEWADAILFANYQVFTQKAHGALKAKGVGGQVRVVYTQHTATWDAKNRFGLPATMPLDMPAILEAMRGGTPDTAENIIAEITELSAGLDAAKQKAATEYVEKNKGDVNKLLSMLNRVRSLTNNEGETVDE